MIVQVLVERALQSSRFFGFNASSMLRTASAVIMTKSLAKFPPFGRAREASQMKTPMNQAKNAKDRIEELEKQNP